MGNLKFRTEVYRDLFDEKRISIGLILKLHGYCWRNDHYKILLSLNTLYKTNVIIAKYLFCYYLTTLSKYVKRLRFV